MKIELEMKPRTFWIQKVDYVEGHPGYRKECEAVVHFDGTSAGQDYKHEEYFYGTAEECLKFVRQYFGANDAK